MEELPTLGQFKELLQTDPIFCDYFNAFLNLPVFAKRLTFVSEEKMFEIEPAINYTYHVVDDSKLLSWVHMNRLPIFWRSDFFYESQLCQALAQQIDEEERRWLTGVAAMHHFRRFLFHTDGEFGCMFWVDVERLKQITDKWMIRRQVNRISEFYLHDNAPFVLSKDIRAKLLLLSEESGHEKHHKQKASKKLIETLLLGQELVVRRLKEYWCPKYKLHLEDRSRPQESDHYLLQSGIDSSKWYKIGARILSISELDKHKRRHKSLGYLPRIISDKGKDGIDVRPKRVSHVKTSSCKLPQLNVCPGQSKVTNVMESIFIGNGRDDIDESMRTLQLLLTPSTLTLFPKSAESMGKNCKDATSLTTQAACLSPYLTACLRADFVSGNPFLRHLKTVMFNSKAVDYLLFWQSVECILTQDEAKRWYRHFNHTSSDQVCPYLSFSEQYPVASDLKELLHLFVKDGAPHKINLAAEVRKELCALLPKGLGQSVSLFAQEKATEFLLKPWQEYMLQDYHNFMKSCMFPTKLHNINRDTLCPGSRGEQPGHKTTPKLLTRLAAPYRHEHSDSALSHLSRQCVVEMAFGSSLLHSMWCALKFAEAIKYPGIYRLPSRRLTDVSLLQSKCIGKEDSDDDLCDIDETVMTLDGISLSPMITTLCDQLLWDWKNNKSKHTIVCTTKPANSLGSFSKKPPVPESFLEVLKDREQLEYFRHFLLMHGVSAEAPLEFWIAVEDLEHTMGNRRLFKSKLKRIKERFLTGNLQRTLMLTDAEISELKKWENPTMAQLLEVQASVTEAMERKWFAEYVRHLTVKEEAHRLEEEEMRLTCSNTSKGLWSMFAHNMISFRRGLMNSSTADMFRRFLHDEVIKVNHSTYKKVIGTKVVNVTKLLNDLSFWAEVERYKDLADIIKEGKLKGTHTPEDDILVHKKAHAIVNCYIDSAVSPRVQINIPHELVGYILDSMSQGLITRGLFHEAALNIFSVLILYWKKFCLARFAPKRQRSAVNSAASLHHQLKRQEWPGQGGHEEHKEWHAFFGDGGPILSYSLLHSIRWFYPGAHQHYHIEHHHQHNDSIHEQHSQILTT